MKNNKPITIKPKQNLMLQKALALHQTGNLDEAELLYKKLLVSLPSHPDILANLGIVAFQKGRLEDAVSIIGKSLAIAPNQPSTLNNRGNALKGLKRLDEAVASYDRAITIQPNFAEAYYNRGKALHDLKRLDDAVASYDKALAIIPYHAEVHYNRGIALHDLNRLDDAVASYDQAIAINPNHAEAYYNRGIALHDLKQFDEAVASYDRAITVEPNHAEAYYNRGNSLRELKRPDEAVASHDRAIVINPNYVEAFSNRGIALQDLNRLDEAAASYDRAIAIKSDYADAYSNRGNALKGLKLLKEAIDCYDRAIAINPNHADAYYNRGIALQEQKRYEDAIASYDQAININPDYANAYWNKALLKLLNGEYIEGWQLYEWGWQGSLRTPEREFRSTLWLGEPSLAGKTLLIYPEQGLGDCIQFIRYATLAEALGAKVIVEAPPGLMAVASTLKGQFTVVEAGKPLPETDFHCPVMSLPLAFKTTVATIPKQVPYLYADTVKQQEWQLRLGEKTKPRIGLVWSGSTIHKNDYNRSITLKTLKPLFDLPVEFHSLQKETRGEDAVFMAANGKIKIHQELLRDFSDTAALIDAMDVVISVDTSVAHLAGAMGKETWILLPHTPDFRWMLERNDTPWYPTAKLYRQPVIGDWESVINKIEIALKRQF